MGYTILTGTVSSPHRDLEKIEVLIEVWDDGPVTIATRRHPSDLWGPPEPLKKQRAS